MCASCLSGSQSADSKASSASLAPPDSRATKAHCSRICARLRFFNRRSSSSLFLRSLAFLSLMAARAFFLVSSTRRREPLTPRACDVIASPPACSKRKLYFASNASAASSPSSSCSSSPSMFDKTPSAGSAQRRFATKSARKASATESRAVAAYEAASLFSKASCASPPRCEACFSRTANMSSSPSSEASSPALMEENAFFSSSCSWL
mmetsp:Transcript_23566/g.79584  ORF Transcript_23566/g.79584 Transcript_23566/m.79584 type:complete len:208 (-) Transcript_23566:465-1088(-)